MEIDLKNLHHAYLVVGSPREVLVSLTEAFKDAGVHLEASPDFFQYSLVVFGIDEARKLSESAQRRAFTERKIFFIAPERITIEAQNALLKTFEEPIPDTHFFLCISDESVVIPTLRSRMQVLSVEHSTNTLQADKFLKLSIKERLAFAKKFADNEEVLPAFLDQILSYQKERGADLSLKKKVYKARLISGDRSASPRMILEHLALVL